MEKLSFEAIHQRRMQQADKSVLVLYGAKCTLSSLLQCCQKYGIVKKVICFQKSDKVAVGVNYHLNDVCMCWLCNELLSTVFF